MSVVFWDFDGTLVYSHHLWSSSVYDALLASDPLTTVTFEQIRKCNTHGFTWQSPNDDHTVHKGDAWWEHMNRHFYNSYLSCGVDEKTAEYAVSQIRSNIKQTSRYHLYPDSVSTLLQLQNAGHQNILLSNNYPDLTEVLVDLGLISLFDGIILSAVEGYEKPRIELFEIAKQRFPHKQYYMVGDTVYADILGGNLASMTTILVHNNQPSPAAYTVDTLQPIINIIR